MRGINISEFTEWELYTTYMVISKKFFRVFFSLNAVKSYFYKIFRGNILNKEIIFLKIAYITALLNLENLGKNEC